MELYLRWLAKYEQEPDENPPLGIILCTGKTHEQIELLELDKSGIHIAEYITTLPPKAELQKKLHQSIEFAGRRFASECDEVARFLGKEPRKSLEMDFKIESISDRRADFKLVSRPLKQKEGIAWLIVYDYLTRNEKKLSEGLRSFLANADRTSIWEISLPSVNFA